MDYNFKEKLKDDGFDVSSLGVGVVMTFLGLVVVLRMCHWAAFATCIDGEGPAVNSLTRLEDSICNPNACAFRVSTSERN